MKRITITALVVLLFYTRFVNLGWGLPYPMHPDERNMAVAVQQLTCDELLTTNYELKNCFNPHFFAYGQLPLYLAYGGVQLSHLATGQIGQPTFLEATLALRTLSALSSILLVFVLLKIVELIFPKKKHLASGFELLALSFLLFQPYSIQFAHFGTTESLLMLLYALIVYYSLKLITNHYSLTTLFLLGIFSGLALGTKTSSVLFLGVPIFVLVSKLVKKGIYTVLLLVHAELRPERVHRSSEATIGELVLGMVLYLFISLIFFFLSSPQSLLNWNDFMSSMNYESSIGLGTYVAFYTRQFVGTIPLLFQFQHILPYVLGLPQLVLSVLGFILLPSNIWTIIVSIIFFILQVARVKGTQQRAKNINPNGYIDVFEHWWGKLRVTESAKLYDLLRLALLLSFLPPSFFFAKWTRFIAPSFPLFTLFALLFVTHLFQKIPYSKFQVPKNYFSFSILVLAFILLISPGIAFLSVYTSPDVRFTASNWIYKNVPANSKILTETANVIDLPIPPSGYALPTTHYALNSFNFYDLDVSSELQMGLSEALKLADYIVVPSRRIFMNHPSSTYPKLGSYYTDLLSGKAGFEKVAEFSSYPKVQLFGNTLFELPDEQAEETWTVFDHPVIRIYKKIQAPSFAEASKGKPNSKSKSNLDFSSYQTVLYQLPTSPYSLATSHSLLVADTPEKWERGLMYVRSKQDIGGLGGMMFTFHNSEKRTFWNKNTLSHLTLYWIHKGRVIGVSDLPSITESTDVVTVSSPSEVDTVIEIIR